MPTIKRTKEHVLSDLMHPLESHERRDLETSMRNESVFVYPRESRPRHVTLKEEPKGHYVFVLFAGMLFVRYGGDMVRLVTTYNDYLNDDSKQLVKGLIGAWQLSEIVRQHRKLRHQRKVCHAV